MLVLVLFYLSIAFDTVGQHSFASTGEMINFQAMLAIYSITITVVIIDSFRSTVFVFPAIIVYTAYSIQLKN